MKRNSFLCKPNVTLEIENYKDSLQNEIIKQRKEVDNRKAKFGFHGDLLELFKYLRINRLSPGR